LKVEEIIEILGLAPHPEGGYYRETWRHGAPEGERGAGTAIYFLLTQERASHWHRVDAAEIWHFYAGAPLELSISTDGSAGSRQVLGADLGAGARPQLVVPPGAWQSARTLGHWTLVGCTVSPAFEFARFELAAPGWAPG
jgi:predicted cupin superfamily sugar epimerase